MALHYEITVKDTIYGLAYGQGNRGGAAVYGIGVTAAGEFVETAISGSGDYVDTVSFNISTGDLTIGRTGILGDIVENLDGRYSLIHTHPYDDYSGWELFVDGTTRGEIASAEGVDFVGGANVTLGYNATGNVITIAGTANDFTDGATFNEVTGDLTISVGTQSDVVVNLDDRYSLITHTHNYDNYALWELYVDDVSKGDIVSAEVVNIKAGSNVSLGYSATNNTITINSSAGSTPLTTYGDIMSYNGGNVRLGAGANGKVLTITAGYPTWETPASGITDHTLLSNIGTNSHAVIDAHLASLHYASWRIYSNSTFRGSIEDDDQVWLQPGDGVSVAYADVTGTHRFTFNNTDKGTDLFVFKSIAVSGQTTVVADNYQDILTLVVGTGMDSITTAGDTITFNAIGVTNLSTAYSGTTVTVESDTGTDAVINGADETNAGVVTNAAQSWAGIKTFTNLTDAGYDSGTPPILAIGGTIVKGGLGVQKDLNVSGGNIRLTNGNGAFFNFEMSGSWAGGGGTMIMRPNNYGSHVEDTYEGYDSTLYRRGLNYEPWGSIPFGVYSYNEPGSRSDGNKLLHVGYYTGTLQGSSDGEVDVDGDVVLAPGLSTAMVNYGGDRSLTTAEWVKNEIATGGNYTPPAEVNDLSAAVTWANIPDGNVPESAVTQHEAALSITTSQISDDTELVMNDTDTYISHPNAQKIITLTQAEYDLIGAPNVNTLFFTSV
jgi:hypothetical protein